MTTPRSLISALLTAGALLASSSLHAQAWQRQINREILSSQAVSNWADARFSVTHNVFYSLLESYESEYVTVNLEAGMEYRIIGKCDNDCSDVDMRLYDGNGRLIDSDTSDDDWPIVRVTVAHGGQFRLKLTMASCATSQCGVGVLVMGR